MSAYNLTNVHEMADGDEEFVKTVIETFIEELPPDIKGLNQAVEYENAQLAYQYAHKIKPNLELFGLNLMDSVLKIENWRNNMDTEIYEINQAAQNISDKVTLAVAELQKDYNL
ncbi:hypothetical protein GCM10009117_12040 [Gangjinia marincola]|uniref:Hpt domain-containing protein n=1 Tax=Gangjinia marincola TaxID=578463 RepID=A0ABP3XWQ5_9FLAO